MVCSSCQIEHEAQDLCRTVVRAASLTPASTPLGAFRSVKRSNTLTMGRRYDSEPAEDPLIGMQLGSFRIIRRLGGGGMGTVYLAEQMSIGSRVAVKVLHPHLASNPSLVQRFQAEALAVNLIGHENIVSIFDMAVAPTGQHFLVMEHLEGAPLAELIRGPVPTEVAIPILAQVCDALAAAHRRGVIHRDLKPENIFLTRRGGNDHFVKLLDFGIAKLLDAHISPQTATGVIVGTPEYMAPEQYLGTEVDGRSDIYALGTIAYQLATGTLPFRTANLAAMMLAHRDLVPEPPEKLNPKITPRFAEVILKALAKRAEDRFQDALELRAALLSALAEAQAPAAPQPKAAPAPSANGFDAVVFSATGEQLRKVRAQELSKAGIFLCADTFTPPLMSRVMVELHAPGGTLELSGEVVRHVTAVQSAAWGMPPGVAVQFVNLSAETRRKLELVLAGKPLVAKPVTPVPDPFVAEALKEWRRRLARDHYTLLNASMDADFDTLRIRGRESRRELDALRQQPLTAEQVAQLDVALEKLAAALHTLTSPARRVEYDARRGNFRGVARCIASGLTVTELDRARNRYLPERPGSESRGRVHAISGEAHAGAGNVTAALESYEQALTEDPLCLRYHQRYWNLRRQAAGQPAKSTPSPQPHR